MTKPIKTLTGVRTALKKCGGHLEQCFRWGGKEWCPWVPNPRFPGIREYKATDDSWVYRSQEPRLLPKGIHELDSLLELANGYFSVARSTDD